MSAAVLDYYKQKIVEFAISELREEWPALKLGVFSSGPDNLCNITDIERDDLIAFAQDKGLLNTSLMFDGTILEISFVRKGRAE